MTKASWIYWIQAMKRDKLERPIPSGPLADKPIKIGTSGNVQKRLATFQTATPEPLQVLHIEPGGLKREKQLHDRWDKHRIPGGEWFHPDPEILDYLANAPAGQRGPEPLPNVGRILATPAVGAWRMLIALVLIVLRLPGRYRRRNRAAVTLLPVTAAASATAYWRLGEHDPWTLPAIVGIILLACTLAGAIDL